MTFQAAASQQGAMFDAQCRYLLKDAGWDIDPRPFVVPAAGVEIDCAARKDGLLLWIEFKGSWRGIQPGMVRTDTTKKAIVSGFLLKVAGIATPYVIVTSHLPLAGSAGDTMARLALESGAVAAIVCINEPNWLDKLHRAATGQPPSRAGTTIPGQLAMFHGGL